VVDAAYRTAFLDWLACACAGSGEPAARAACEADRSLLGRVAALGAAGHVLDFDDTYAPGLAHCSAPTAPAALVLGADRGCSMRDVLSAYARGFEATASVARASHPELYRRGWHPTAVCGVVGSAVTSATLLDIDVDTAVNVALLQAAGLRAAFGSDGKALQVGMAAAAGARAALLVRAGTSAPAAVRAGFEAAYGATWSLPGSSHDVITSGDNAAAIRGNWIKVYPCCLQTHSAIEAAARTRESGHHGGVMVRVHPVSLQAAPYGVPTTPLQAKFSIPYTVAFTLLHGPPRLADFAALDDGALRLSKEVEVRADDAPGESEAIIEAPGAPPFRIEAALGSPQRPLTQEQLEAKVASLTSLPLQVFVRDDTPAADVLRAIVTADA
jgi:2-methylcitrate dehydratase PrpD